MSKFDHIKGKLECMQCYLGIDEELSESLQVGIKGRAGTGDIIVDVCYRPPDLKWWSSRSLGQRGGFTASSLPWASGEQTLAYSETCLVEYHGILPWREEEPRRAG